MSKSLYQINVRYNDDETSNHDVLNYWIVLLAINRLCLMQSKLYGVNISPNINKEAKSFCNNIFLIRVFLFRTSEGRNCFSLRVIT